MFTVAKKIINKIKYKRRKNKILNTLPNIGNGFNIITPFSVEGGNNVYIGDDFFANSNLRIEAVTKYNDKNFHPNIYIGNNVSFGQSCHIGCINKVIISDGVLLGSYVLINDHSHGDTHHVSDTRPALRDLISKGEIYIGENVWIGDGVVIMPNVSIGKNTIIGANSVVTKSLPENVIAAGIPAKIIRTLDKI